MCQDCSICFTCTNSFNAYKSQGRWTIITSILQMMAETESEEGNITSKWQSQDLNPDILIYLFFSLHVDLSSSSPALWATILVIIGGGVPPWGCAKVLRCYGKVMQQVMMPSDNMLTLIIVKMPTDKTA